MHATETEHDTVGIGLNAAIVAVLDNEPVALVVAQANPTAPARPTSCRSALSARANIAHLKAACALGCAIRPASISAMPNSFIHSPIAAAMPEPGDATPHVVSIGYLALTEASADHGLTHGIWRSWYQYFPWEDWRRSRPDIIANEIEPRLKLWAERPSPAATPQRPIARADRVRMCFGLDGAAWDEEKVLERYELLYEAGLIEEALRDGRSAAQAWTDRPKLGLADAIRSPPHSWRPRSGGRAPRSSTGQWCSN